MITSPIAADNHLPLTHDKIAPEEDFPCRPFGEQAAPAVAVPFICKNSPTHRGKWKNQDAQEQRTEEQALRDQMKQEAQATYSVFKDLDQQIIVDLRSFTVSELPEPVEIVLSETGSQSSSSENQKPVLVAPAPHTRTKLKTPSSLTARAGRRAPVKSKRKYVKPRQDGIFKRFTLLVVEYVREKFVWAKKKPVASDIEHDKRIAENYVFDEIQGIYVSRAEHERRARFNSDDYKPASDEIRRFPSRPEKGKPDADNNVTFTPSMPTEYTGKSRVPKLRPPGYRHNRDSE